MAALADLSHRASDTLVARGERAASAVVAAALHAAGRRAERVDAAEIVATDGHHGARRPRPRRHAPERATAPAPLLKRGVTPVVPGFLGSGPDGTVTTLGRGGSDLTATLLARSLGASRVVLWKDVAGILTADPRAVPDARLLPQMHHREAAEVAYFGAKVLHPRALIPLDGSGIALHVRSFLHPERPGTEVSARRTLAAYPVKALATIRGQALVTVAGKGLMGVPGIAARTFAASTRTGSRSRRSSSRPRRARSASRCPAPRPTARSPPSSGPSARRSAAGLVDGVTARRGVAVIAVVGRGMAGTPGVAARVFSALASARVNVIAIAQGSSELNISFVVDEAQAAEAARRVHSAFQLAKIGGGQPPERRTDVVLLGFGRVGRALAGMAAGTGDGRIRIVAALDRSGYVFDPRGVSRGRLLRLAEGKDEGALLAELGGRPASAAEALGWIASHAVSRPVLVDVTADETVDLLTAALGQGFDLVLANKKPLAGPPASYRRLLETAAAAGRRVRYEATVGAGLPGDRHLPQARRERRPRDARRGLRQRDARLRALRARARAPLLGGRARGGRRRATPSPTRARTSRARTSCARASSSPASSATPAPPRRPRTSCPPALRRLPPRPLPRAAGVARRGVAAPGRGGEAARGRVLRYVVVATARGVRASLRAVPRDSAFGSLQGTRNLLSFTTRRYRAEPLVVAGPGAGAEVTAAGILNDIQSLADVTP